MAKVSAKTQIQASTERVFQAIADVVTLPEVSPEVVKVEFLSEQREGIGTRFRETRSMRGGEAQTELVITEYEPMSHVRMVAESHGTVWDSLFAIHPATDAEQTVLTITMWARTKKLHLMLLNRLFSYVYRRSLREHAEHVKAFCEEDENT